MTFQGTVKNGVVVLDTDSPPAEGTRVKVEVESSTEVAVERKEEFQSWADVVLKYAGCMEGLPADFAAEHDHYVHGTPKRSQSER